MSPVLTQIRRVLTGRTHSQWALQLRITLLSAITVDAQNLEQAFLMMRIGHKGELPRKDNGSASRLELLAL